jgi:hypothetical protein
MSRKAGTRLLPNPDLGYGGEMGIRVQRHVALADIRIEGGSSLDADDLMLQWSLLI